MGLYFNPSNIGFMRSLRSKIYVDKSGIISYTNSVQMTQQSYICVSRPRRFGKTMTAEMLAAYYSRGCDSAEMFTNLTISKDASYKKHLNQYDVIFLNVQQFLSNSIEIKDVISNIENKVTREILEIYPDLSQDCLVDVLNELYTITQIQLVFIIDEWDCIFREDSIDDKGQRLYLDFLRNLLKDRNYVGLAYMTGILPIKKYGSHSALNMFYEFSMTDPRQLAQFVGFTQEEVKSLCNAYNMDYDELSKWYNGYSFLRLDCVYNPKSVVEALLSQNCSNYWTQTETYEALSIYFKMNFDNLKNIVIQLLVGGARRVNTRKFSNDMVTFKYCDDILTLLIHLGYLKYHIETSEVSIPNKEISDEFETAVDDANWGEIVETLELSDALLKATWNADSETVAQIVDKMHNEVSILQYNDENALSYIISLAYYTAKQHYSIVREMPSGKGYADLTFVPRKITTVPAMIVELKWDKSAVGAIQQIKDKNYVDSFQDYSGEILLVGINYNKKMKSHECKIESHVKTYT